MLPSVWSSRELLPLLLECGRIALHYFPLRQWRLKADRTLVTPADGEIEALLATHFDRPDLGSRMLGEETADQKGEGYIRDLFRGAAWVVDPIDGTAAYAHGLAYWGISVGFMLNGEICQGAVYLPRQGELFISEGDSVWFADNVDAARDPAHIELRELKPEPLVLNEGGMIALSQVVAKRGLFSRPNPVQVTGCAVNSLTYLMLGRYAAYVAHIKLWDMAGAWPLLQKTGFSGMFMDGGCLSARVDASGYLLAPGDPRRWCLRDDLIFARSADLPVLRGAVQFP